MIDALSPYDDGLDLSDYDFSQDNIGPPKDDHNKRKLAYRHRIIAQKYKQVFKMETLPIPEVVLVLFVIFFFCLSPLTYLVAVWNYVHNQIYLLELDDCMC